MVFYTPSYGTSYQQYHPSHCMITHVFQAGTGVTLFPHRGSGGCMGYPGSGSIHPPTLGGKTAAPTNNNNNNVSTVGHGTAVGDDVPQPTRS